SKPGVQSSLFRPHGHSLLSPDSPCRQCVCISLHPREGGYGGKRCSETSTGERVPIVLVGNKSDLIAKRQVSQDMAMKLAQESMHNCQYLETSAKYNVNVSELFSELLQQAYSMEQQQQTSSGGLLPGPGGSSSLLGGPGDPGRPPDSPLQRSSRKLSH
ncbi:unnamed protein product, partial [Ixodes pacificus]